MSSVDSFYNISSRVCEYDIQKKIFIRKDKLPDCVLKIPIHDTIHQEYIEIEFRKYCPVENITEIYFYVIPNILSLELLLTIRFRFVYLNDNGKKSQTKILLIDPISRRYMTNLYFSNSTNILKKEDIMKTDYLEKLKDPNYHLKNSLPDNCFQNWKKIFRRFTIPKYFLKYNSILDIILQRKNEYPIDSIWFHLSQLPDELILIIFSYFSSEHKIWIEEYIPLNKFFPRNNPI